MTVLPHDFSTFTGFWCSILPQKLLISPIHPCLNYPNCDAPSKIGDVQKQRAEGGSPPVYTSADLRPPLLVSSTSLCYRLRCGIVFFALDRFGVNDYPPRLLPVTGHRHPFSNNYGKDFSMSFNFFDWVRDGVKNSVLHGVNDAVLAMGMPPEEHSKDKVLGWLQKNADSEAPGRRITNGTAPAGTKKLGRSPLSEIATKEAS